MKAHVDSCCGITYTFPDSTAALIVVGISAAIYVGFTLSRILTPAEVNYEQRKVECVKWWMVRLELW